MTPFRLRAVTSRPSGKCKSIFLTFGKHKGLASISGSPREVGEVFSFLQHNVNVDSDVMGVARQV